MIEVLVSLLVLAIGLLGVAALQFRGFQYSHEAYLRSQISLLMYDMVDRIRLNPDNADDYLVTDMATTGTPPACDPSLGTNATNDLNCWQGRLIETLPPGTTASILNPTGNEYSIEIAWTDRTSNLHEIAYRFEP